tara:strand:+ start:884 stop:1060 length:177 start_codon:yes stop_codon:yes gene_type:complete
MSKQLEQCMDEASYEERIIFMAMMSNKSLLQNQNAFEIISTNVIDDTYGQYSAKLLRL